MEVTTILLTSLGILSILLAIQGVLLRWIRIIRLARRIPGPKPTPLLGNYDIYRDVRKGSTKKLFRNFEHYKMYVVWYGPVPVLVVRHPDHLKVVLGNSVNINKLVTAKFFCLKYGIISLQGNTWRLHRKMTSPAFSFNMLSKFVEVFGKKSEVLVDKLKNEAEGKSFMVNRYIYKCAIDCSFETLLGTESNRQDQDEPDELGDLFIRYAEMINRRIASPWLYPDFIYFNTRNGRWVKRAKQILEQLTLQAIEERKQKTSTNRKEDNSLNIQDIRNKMTLIDILLEGSENGNKFTAEELVDELITFFLAGFEPTTLSICWTLQELGTHQHVQEKVFEEMDKIFQGSDRSTTMNDLIEMKYLERVIKESLRFNTVVPIPDRYLSEDIELDGYTIPAGMRILNILGSTHRIAEFFPNPLEFNPDNFLPEKEAQRHPYAFVPFSAGPRNCIGYKYAMLEMKIIISNVIRNFRVQSKKDRLQSATQITLRSVEEFPMYITRRNLTSY